MKISYNELPPKTREKIKEIGGGFENEKYKNKGTSNFLDDKYIAIYENFNNEAARCSSIAHCVFNSNLINSNYSFDEKYDLENGWIKLIIIFDNFSDELKEELFPYLFGESENNDNLPEM